VSTGTWTDGVSRYGNGAYLFDANTKYLSFASNDIFRLGDGTQNFHVGCWFKRYANNTTPILFERFTPSVGYYMQLPNTSAGSPQLYISGVAGSAKNVPGPAGSTPVDDVWRYICTQRVGDTLTTYVDGMAGTPVSWAYTLLESTRPLIIGAYNGGGATASNSYVQGFEISKPGTLLDVTGGKRPLR